MFGPFERIVAGRYLRARRGERFVSIIALFSLTGIALGVSTLIVVMSVMDGFKSDLLSRILGFNGHLGIYGAGEPLTQYDALAQRIQSLPGVAAAIPVMDGQALLTTETGGAVGGFVRGLSKSDLVRLHSVSDHILVGSLARFEGDDAIAIGIGLAQRFGLTVGQSLTLVSPQGASTAFGTIPRVRAYRIVAIFQVGMNEYDSNYAFLPLDAAQIFFQQPKTVTQIEVMVDDADHVERTSAAIRNALNGVPVRITDWQQSNNGFFAAMQVEENVMFLILALIVVVAAFNVISSMMMLVKDKARDIAVLRTLGATRSAVMRVFLMCGASVGVLGTATGTVLGVVFCLNIQPIQHLVETFTDTKVFNPEIYYLAHLPARLNTREVIDVVVMSLSLSLTATLYPSWRAAKTDPIEALRHE